MNDLLIVVLVAGLASGVASTTIAQSKLFARVRNWVVTKTANEDGEISWFGELVTCPYCLGHWLSIALCMGMRWFQPMLWLAVIAVSVITSGVIARLYASE